jgi:hypothetical protein
MMDENERKMVILDASNHDEIEEAIKNENDVICEKYDFRRDGEKFGKLEQYFGLFHWIDHRGNNFKFQKKNPN